MCRYSCEYFRRARRADDNSENSDEHSSRSSLALEGSCNCSYRTETLDDMGIFELTCDPEDYLQLIVKVSLSVGVRFKGGTGVPEFMRQRDALVWQVCIPQYVNGVGGVSRLDSPN